MGEHFGHWRCGDVPNGGPSYAFVECSCGWTSADLYGDEAGVDGAPAGVGPDPETQFREHIATKERRQ